MGFLSKKRSDGYLVKDIDPYALLNPYIMPKRTESCVFYGRKIDVTNALEFLAEKKEQGEYITMFNLVVAAIKRTIQERPKMHRFIAGDRIYEHKNFEVVYVVKRSLTDSAGDTIAHVGFEPSDKLEDVARKMNEYNKELKDGADKDVDKLMNIFHWMPRIVLRMVVGLINILDYHGMLPKAFREMLPFYSSIWIANLGSIGADAPFHHLYELGTTSIFMTIGKITEEVIHGEKGDERRKFLDIKITLDERICDGFYNVRSLRLFERYIAKPHMIDREKSDRESQKTVSAF